jgi:hypothetical protein
MATSKNISLQVSDIIKWFNSGELVINETFQRHSIWTTAAKTYLVDTVLNELPMPKIYIRTKIDIKTKTTLREVVDGQQRVRALCEFGNGKLRLTSRSERFAGETYESLNEDDQSKFLAYTLSVEQLLNASDDDVIDMFARLNSYIVSLNAAEKRHAAFQTDFKFAVRKSSQDWRPLWEKIGTFTLKQRFRMADDVLMAEIYQVFLEGVSDGGAPRLEKLYKTFEDDTFTTALSAATRTKLDASLRFINDELADALTGVFSKHYHILILVAAYAHQAYGIPAGDIGQMPIRSKLAPTSVILDRLAKIEEALAIEKPPKRYLDFINATTSSTQRILSRRVRFLEFVNVFAA